MFSNFRLLKVRDDYDGSIKFKCMADDSSRRFVYRLLVLGNVRRNEKKEDKTRCIYYYDNTDVLWFVKRIRWYSFIEIIDICLILLIGFIKGIYLGKRKVVEYIDDRWYMRHDKKYILVWVLFFAVKLLIAQILKLITGLAVPFWHMILYFCFYYPWRTINVFITNPDMRKAVLKKK